MKHITLQDIFIKSEMWRFSENSAIFSDRQNFGRRNRIRHIIFIAHLDNCGLVFGMIFAKFRHIFGPPKFRSSQFRASWICLVRYVIWMIFTNIPSQSLPSDEDMTTTSFASSTLFFRDFLLCGPCRSINISWNKTYSFLYLIFKSKLF